MTTPRATAARQPRAGREENDGPRAIEPIGALAQWRRELSDGLHGQDTTKPRTWRLDALHRAACFEAMGFDHARSGNLYAANAAFLRAAEIIADAIAAKAKRAA